jgi:hypothetical protein
VNGRGFVLELERAEYDRWTRSVTLKFSWRFPSCIVSKRRNDVKRNNQNVSTSSPIRLDRRIASELMARMRS